MHKYYFHRRTRSGYHLQPGGEDLHVQTGWGGAGVPIHSKTEMVGMILVSVPLPREITPAELKFLSSLSEMAGMALHRLYHHDQSDRRVVHLQSLRTLDKASTASLDLPYILNALLEQLINRHHSEAAIAIENAVLVKELQQVNLELALAYDVTIEGWARVMELRDYETEGHTRRVAELTVDLAARMGIPEQQLIHIRRGALLHDIGKMGVPDAILFKSGQLTEEEWQIMRRHSVMAYEMLSNIEYLRPAISIPYCHHEKWDGSGYPRGLKGEEIPLEARIFTVVDVFDALTNDRPYRPAWNREKALEYIRRQKGAHFDPRVVELFLCKIATQE